jgi:hypothetical protein
MGWTGVRVMICRKCEVDKPTAEFYFRKDNGKHRAECKVCCNERGSVYYTLNRHKMNAKSREWAANNKQKRYEAHKRQDPLKLKARYIVSNAIAQGKLTRPQYCQSCVMPGKLEAHHDDYSQPLSVRFLCRGCHKKYHRMLKEAT